MNLENLGKPRFNFTFVRRFPEEETRRRFGRFEEVYGSYIAPSANVANLPQNAPPPVPRFSMHSSKKNLVVSNIFAQLDLDFSEGIPKGYDFKSILLRSAEQADKMDTLFPDQSVYFSGVIVTATMPYKVDQSKALSDLFKSIYGRDPIEELSSVTNATGIIKGGIIIQTSIGQYKIIKAQSEVLSSDVPHSIHIDFDFLPSEEEGVEFKWDANTKPLMNTPEKGQFVKICNALIEFISNKQDEPWSGVI